MQERARVDRSDFYRGIDFRAHPEKYRIGRGEEGVLTAEPYKSELLPLWRFRTPEIARTSAGDLWSAFERYREAREFVGLDMARKFIQMGYTRARRYANHPSGRKYAADGSVIPRGLDPVKAAAAEIFLVVWRRAEADPVYAAMKRSWHPQIGKDEMTKATLKDPEGGLTAAGRKAFAKKDGSHLRPGVRGKADTPEKMRRKGSFLRRHFATPRGPMVDDKGEPTRLALSAHAWGEPVPKTRTGAKKLAAKGKTLLAKYAKTKGEMSMATTKKKPAAKTAKKSARKSAGKTATKAPAKKRASAKKAAAPKKNSLVANINRRKRAGKSRPKSKSTVSKESYDKMEEGWPESKKKTAKKKTRSK